MTQDERWIIRYEEVKGFVKDNKRNPSKHDDEERGRYLNWMKHNRKLLNSGEMKLDRVEMMGQLVDLWEERKRVNQYQ